MLAATILNAPLAASLAATIMNAAQESMGPSLFIVTLIQIQSDSEKQSNIVINSRKAK